MDPATISLIAQLISMGAPIVGGLLGDLFAGPDAEKSRQQLEQALADLNGISLPQAASLIESSAMEGVQRNQGLEGVQDDAMARLHERATGGGLDATSRARLEQQRLESGQRERSQREAVLADARARGTLGTGDELAALLQAGQAGADRERMAGLQSAAMADESALQALLEGGRMAERRSGTQWGQDAEVARARDDIAKFNAGINQQDFANRLALIQARTGIAGQYGGRADATRGVGFGVGQGVGYGAGALAQQLEQPQPTAKPAAAAQPAPQVQAAPPPAVAPQAAPAVPTAASGDPYQKRKRLTYS